MMDLHAVADRPYAVNTLHMRHAPASAARAACLHSVLWSAVAEAATANCMAPAAGRLGAAPLASFNHTMCPLWRCCFLLHHCQYAFRMTTHYCTDLMYAK